MDTKRLLLEGFLIIFSVFLALGLNEVRENYSNRKTAENALQKLKAELKRNKDIMGELEEYHNTVLENISNYEKNDSLKHQLITENGFDIQKLAFKGVDTRIISKTGWEIAKSHDITQYIDFDLATCLINCYNQQDHVNFNRERIIEILADRQTNDPEQIENTLTILNKYYGMLRAQEAILNAHYQEFITLIGDE